MKRDYLVYPSMIGAQSGVIWSYNSSDIASTFDDTHPLDVSASECNDLSICLWYNGMYHLYGNLMIQLKQNMLFLANGINGQLLVNNDSFPSSLTQKKLKQQLISKEHLLKQFN
jgi:hypothetical protein